MLEAYLVNRFLSASHAFTEYYFLWGYGGWGGVAVAKRLGRKKDKVCVLVQKCELLTLAREGKPVFT